MNIRDYIEKTKKMHADLPRALQETLYPKVSETTLRRFKRRVFSSGLAADETTIGNYSSNPISASKSIFVKKGSFVPTKKGGKTMQLKGGYKELKQVQGLKSDNVNLVYSGDLRQSVQKKETESGFMIGFTDSDNAEKAKRLEKKYSKKIFALSEDERLKLARESAREVRRIQKSYFYAN